MGRILVMGPKGNLVTDHVAGLCGFPACETHQRLVRRKNRHPVGHRIRGCNVYIFWCELSAGTAQLLLENFPSQGIALHRDLSQTIGSLFMVGIPGSELDGPTREFLSEIRPCGVILFSRNIESPRQVAELNRDLQKFAISINIDPLFISVDQEGGRVRRLREPFSAFPSSWEMATSHNPDSTVRNFAQQTALELRLAGFNMDFVPALDVVSELVDLKSTVIGDRSFGSDPERVAHFGNIVISEMRSHGVIPCAKHFPGHGATTVDSHFDLPVDGRSLEDLTKRDLIPFQSAVQNNVEMIMTAHVLFSDIDSAFPATMSEQILYGLLRKTMKYRGIVITDDLDMGAVSKKYSTEKCVIESFRAGADILLICNSSDKATEALSTLKRAFSDGVISNKRLLNSTSRIRHLKQSFSQSFQPCDPEHLLSEMSR